VPPAPDRHGSVVRLEEVAVAADDDVIDAEYTTK